MLAHIICESMKHERNDVNGGGYLHLWKKSRPAHYYRLTDRFTAKELNQLVTRYKAGEMSTTLARESGIAKSTFLRLLAERGVGTRPRDLTPAKEG